MQGDARLHLFVLLWFGAGTRFPAFGAASLHGRGCRVTESGVETEPMPTALILCSHELKLIRWMISELQLTCTVYTEQVLASVAVLFVKVHSETRKAVLPQQ
jgi:hypothetical protein